MDVDENDPDLREYAYHGTRLYTGRRGVEGKLGVVMARDEADAQRKAIEDINAYAHEPAGEWNVRVWPFVDATARKFAILDRTIEAG